MKPDEISKAFTRKKKQTRESWQPPQRSIAESDLADPTASLTSFGPVSSTFIKQISSSTLSHRGLYCESQTSPNPIISFPDMMSKPHHREQSYQNALPKLPLDTQQHLQRQLYNLSIQHTPQQQHQLREQQQL